MKLPRNNLPCMIGISERTDEYIAATLNGSLSLEAALARLSWFFAVKITFRHPRNLRHLRGWKDSATHLFRCFFISDLDNFCYGYKRISRRGHPISLADAIEITFIHEEPKEFASYEQFKARFNLRFIKEEGIKSLWNSKSGQHGGKYNRNDFKKIGKVGKQVMKRFLNRYIDINTPHPSCSKSNLYPERQEDVWVHTEKHHTDHRLGRDISISYQSNSPYLYYSSEYMDCGNGDYGLIVNESTYLYLEKD